MYCTECLWTWPSSRLKRHHFGYPVPDKIVKMDTLFQTEKCDTHLTFESEKACVSKYVAGPEWELATTFIYSATLAVTPTVFSSRNNKNFTLFQTEKLIGRPFFPDSERQKPYKLYSSYMRVHRSPPPPPPPPSFAIWICFLGSSASSCGQVTQELAAITQCHRVHQRWRCPSRLFYWHPFWIRDSTVPPMSTGHVSNIINQTTPIKPIKVKTIQLLHTGNLFEKRLLIAPTLPTCVLLAKQICLCVNYCHLFIRRFSIHINTHEPWSANMCSQVFSAVVWP